MALVVLKCSRPTVSFDLSLTCIVGFFFGGCLFVFSWPSHWWCRCKHCRLPTLPVSSIYDVTYLFMCADLRLVRAGHFDVSRSSRVLASTTMAPRWRIPRGNADLRLVRAGADSCTRGSYASICISERYCSQTSSTYVLSRGEIRTNTDRCASSPRMHVYPNVFCNLRRSVVSSHPQSMKHGIMFAAEWWQACEWPSNFFGLKIF